jgi:hypothetical protein
MVFDVRNRAKESCNLRDFIVQLPTENGYGYRFGGGPDRSAIAKIFADTQSRMLPGGAEVHSCIHGDLDKPGYDFVKEPGFDVHIASGELPDCAQTQAG